VASRLAYAAVGLAALERFPSYRPARPWPQPAAPPELAIFSRWDSQWYLRIAAHGYAPVPGHFSPYVYFPLLPGLLHLVPSGARLWGGEILVAAAAVAALWLLARETEDLLGGGAGMAAAAALIAYPLSFLLSAPYTEAPFLLLSAGALRCGRVGRWYGAALLAAAAALTRNLGVLLVVPLGVWAVERAVSGGRAHALGRAWRAAWPAMAAPLVALGLFALYLAYRTGTPAAFLVHEHAWGRMPAWPWSGVVRAVQGMLQPHAGPPPPPGRPAIRYSAWDRGLYDAWDLASLVLAVAALGYAARRRLPRAYLVWGGLLVAAPLCAPTMHGAYALASTSRYVLADLPVFMGIGAFLARHPRAAPALLVPMSLLGGLAMSLYVTWNWIA
jgi:hypothetical protein